MLERFAMPLTCEEQIERLAQGLNGTNLTSTLEARREDIEKAVPADLSEDEINQLIFEGDKPHKNTDRSVAGRSIDKHGCREPRAFPAPKGSAKEVNQQGREELEKILRHPEVKEQPNKEGGKDYVLPDGKGARYKGNGEFKGFLEPS